MKRLCTIIKLLILSYMYSFALGPGPDKILARSGEHIFTQSEMNLYYDILGFMIEKPLSLSEQHVIAQEVVKAFEQEAKRIKSECWALQETLNFIASKPGPEKIQEIRNNLFETLAAFEAKGGSNRILDIVRKYKPTKFLPKEK